MFRRILLVVIVLVLALPVILTGWQYVGDSGGCFAHELFGLTREQVRRQMLLWRGDCDLIRDRSCTHFFISGGRGMRIWELRYDKDGRVDGVSKGFMGCAGLDTGRWFFSRTDALKDAAGDLTEAVRCGEGDLNRLSLGSYRYYVRNLHERARVYRELGLKAAAGMDDYTAACCALPELCDRFAMSACLSYFLISEPRRLFDLMTPTSHNPVETIDG